MKYSIYQLQALDFLQKKVTANGDTKFTEKTLKLVFKYENTVWTGDFLIFKGAFPLLHHLIGDSEIYRILGDHDSQLLSKVWTSYCKQFERFEISGRDNPLFETEELYIFLDIIKRFVDEAQITKEDKLFQPRIFNLESLDGRIKLPFVNVSEQCEIELVSIIEKN